jgi:hypothetical protein
MYKSGKIWYNSIIMMIVDILIWFTLLCVLLMTINRIGGIK